ncbi:MAG: hypothetical protein AAF677_16825, partial [Pseudomonadota bacterium]
RIPAPGAIARRRGAGIVRLALGCALLRPPRPFAGIAHPVALSAPAPGRTGTLDGWQSSIRAARHQLCSRCVSE